MNNEIKSMGNHQALSDKPLKLAKILAFIVYALQALSIFFGITFLVAVVINYWKRDLVQGTWLASHFQWQIGTFWVGLFIIIAGTVTTFIGIGYLILILGYVWIIYRVVKGGARFKEGQTMED